ncbi:MAG: ATPase [Micrococcales bacterium]|nr:MAG: ATPase [Micrococcales bacterium]
MDPVVNPYAPGAGQRPPELAGRDGELHRFDVVLERVARGRPERSLVLIGLRGVGKTVLLNAFRSAAVRRGWGTGKIEARPGASLRRPLAAALHQAIRELSGRHKEQADEVLGVVKAFAMCSVGAPAKGRTVRDRWQPGIDVPAVGGRADSGDIEIDLVELFTDVAGLAAAAGKGVAICIDEMQDLGTESVSALCGASHELSQQGLPLLVVGAGLPHVPAVLSASKSYSERLFRYVRIDRLEREQADRALLMPAEDEGVTFTEEALAGLYAATDGYPYFVQAYGKTVWDVATTSPVTAEDVRVAAPQAETELAVGFFGSRYERATPAEREYMLAMANLGDGQADAPVSTSDIAISLGRKPQSLSPARDSLLKKGLVWSGERGQIAFTVPHFGKYLRSQE